VRETREERGGRRRARRTSLPPPDPFVSSPGGVYLVDTDALPSPDEVVDAPDAVAPAGPSRPFFVEATYATDGAGAPIDVQAAAVPVKAAADAPPTGTLDAAGDAGWAEPGEPDRDARDNTPPSDLV
jgi:hypothetical protein